MAEPGDGSGVVEVLPDVTGLDRTFHYSSEKPLRAGTIVRVLLNGRRVRGWVVGSGEPPPQGVDLRPLLEVVSEGPPPEVVDLCRWTAWRWAGRLRPALVAASPERVVRAIPAAVSARPAKAEADPIVAAAVHEALSKQQSVLRLPPLAPRLDVVLACLASQQVQAGGGSILTLIETHPHSHTLLRQLASRGVHDALALPDAWPEVAAGSGSVVVGTRNAVFSPGEHSAIVVLDAHSEAYRAERSPNFDARVLAAERARRAGIPVLFVTPAPTLELLEHCALQTFEPSWERRGWGTLGVLDRREEDPAEGGYSSRLATMVRRAVDTAGGRPVVLVLNRAGRARLLVCDSCGEVQRCERCGAALVQLDSPPKGEIGELACLQCGLSRQALCPACGSARLRIRRPGVSKAREQLEALLGLPVGEVAGPRSGKDVPDAPVLVGTEAVLHRVPAAALVVFLDFDQELFAPRFRAAEQALALLVRAIRLVGAGKDRSQPSVVVRTSHPASEVVKAAQRGDPSLVSEPEKARRALLRLPPEVAMAVLTAGGRDAVERVAALPEELSVAPTVTEPGKERWVVLAPDEAALADGLATIVAHEPGGWASVGLHVEVDPLSL